MPLANLDGYSMHYQVDDFTDPWETADTVLLQHGYCRSSRFWYSWVPVLARHYRVLRPDARGCGDSPSPGKEFEPSLEGFVDDIVALMDRLGIERVHYAGESFGGIIGLQLAYSHPERVKSLILCNTPCKLPNTMATDYAAGYPDTSAAIDALGIEAWCLRTINFRLDQDRASGEMSRWYAREMAKTDPTMAKRWLAFQPSMDFTPNLPGVKVPVLLLAAGRSPIAGLAQQKLMAERMPNAQLEVIDGVGHGVNILAPDRCTTAALRFLNQVR